MAGTVNPQTSLPLPTGTDGMSLRATLIQWANVLVAAMLSFGQRINLCLPKDGSEAMIAPLPLASYTTATRPAASTANKGCVIYVSDAAAGSNFQGSTGSAWVSLG